MTTQTLTQTQEAQEQEHPIILGNINLSKYVSRPTICEQEKEKAEIASLERELTRIDSFIASSDPLYPCEEKYLESISTNKSNVLFNKQKISAKHEISVKYPKIDLSFLDMSHFYNFEGIDFPLPVFVSYSLKDNQDTFEVRYEKSEAGNIYVRGDYRLRSISPYLNQKLQASESKKMGFGKLYKFVTEFSGLIPNETKNKIKEAEEFLQKLNITENLYLVAEAPIENWNASKEVPIRDPLIVASTDFGAYLIDHFNMTPLEDYVRKEFTREKLEDK
ncbi:MAG: hypothetical protein ACP5OG_04185 [Candidatus Nanoarchaeia archaeon]